MKALSILFATALSFLLWDSVHAQVLNAARIFPEARAYTASEKADRIGDQKDALLLLPTVPVTFTSLKKDTTGIWRMGAAMTLGVGATLLLGKATFESKTASIQPWIIAGGALNAGVEDDPTDGVVEVLKLSGFFGVGNIALNFSRELLGGDTSVGLALKIDVITNLAPDAYMCLSRNCRE